MEALERAIPELSGALVVRVSAEDGGIFEGQVVETGPYDAVVDFGQARSPVLPLGAELTVIVRGRGAEEPDRNLVGRVVGRTEDELWHRYRIHFGEAEGKLLRTAFYRRFAPRVQPALGESLACSIRGEVSQALIPVTVRDLSVIGLALELSRAADHELYAEWGILIELSLAPGEAPLELYGFVRHRNLGTGVVSYGIVLDRALSPGGEADFERLGRFVAGRLETGAPDSG